ncbi:MAG: CopG family ribbon-helix-helix protein [Pyrobaculum sp.]
MKRFGVSLPKEVAYEVDKVSEELGVTRSELVANALQQYLESRRNHSDPSHQCLGVLLALSDADLEIGDMVEESKSLIVAYTHMHVDGKCLTILVLKGGIAEIERLTLEVSKRAHMARYIPLL